MEYIDTVLLIVIAFILYDIRIEIKRHVNPNKYRRTAERYRQWWKDRMP